MSLPTLTFSDLVKNTSNAFIGTVAEMFEANDDTVQDSQIKSLLRENRYMYLALLGILLLIAGNLFFTT